MKFTQLIFIVSMVNWTSLIGQEIAITDTIPSKALKYKCAVFEELIEFNGQILNSEQEFNEVAKIGKWDTNCFGEFEEADFVSNSVIIVVGIFQACPHPYKWVPYYGQSESALVLNIEFFVDQTCRHYGKHPFLALVEVPKINSNTPVSTKAFFYMHNSDRAPE